MRKNAFLAITRIARLNEFKNKTLKTYLSKEVMYKCFKDCKIPACSLFFTEFKKELLIRVSRNTYIWKNSNPIHYKVLQDIYSRYQKKANGYVNAYNERKRSVALEHDTPKCSIQEAIKFLKENGFEVFYPADKLYVKM